MKRLFVLLLLITSTLGLSAQVFQRHGVALGADRDTLLYIIASPFDNWYITVGGGIQTFMGNEIVSSARHNKLNFNGRIDIGKWIIPDLSVSGRLSLFGVDGQSKYPLQPFINPQTDDTNANGYYPFHANALSLLGLVTFDWTNFINGYEIGKRTKLHVFTPVGLGMSMLFGTQRNPRGTVGEFRRNFELAFTGGIGVEYEVSQTLALKAIAELFGSESTWDWSPYNNQRTIFDIIPSISVGARFNFINQITKYNPYTKKSTHVSTFHEFQTVGSRSELIRREGEVMRLTHVQDSLEDLIETHSDQRLALEIKYDSVSNLKDSLIKELQNYRQPVNMLDELIAANEILGLPATIVYFQLDRYDLDYNGLKKLQNFAREVNQLDDTMEFYIVGAADSATGTPRHNVWLSEHRCEAAYNMLVDHYGVSANQLIQVPVGGITDYDPQENNRMALVILRTPQTEEIVERWKKRINR